MLRIDIRGCVRVLMTVSAMFAAVFSMPPGVRAKVVDPKTFTLANGMQVVVISNHRAPIVIQMVWY